MATKPLLEKLRDAYNNAGNSPGLTANSLRWFMDYIRKNVTQAKFQVLKAGSKQVHRIRPGFIYTYNYDPKLKATLPYYDTAPLVLVTSVTPNGWYGINFHYLPARMRMLIFTELLSVMNNDKMDESTRLKASWAKALQLSKAVNGTRGMENSIKQYLDDHVVGLTWQVLPEYWEQALFLPTQRFMGAPARTVWRRGK
jgi:hypothetical protein